MTERERRTRSKQPTMGDGTGGRGRAQAQANATAVGTADATDGPTPRPRGRPRDPETDAAILAATLEELKIGGYNGMSMQSIADRARVTKPTIYRRWPGKPALAVAALGELISHEERVDTSDVRAALHLEMAHMHENLIARGAIPLLGTLLVERERHPEFLEVYREVAVNLRFSRFCLVLRAGVERGELRADTDVEAAALLLMGFGFANYVANDDEREPGWLLAALNIVLDGLRPQRSCDEGGAQGPDR